MKVSRVSEDSPAQLGCWSLGDDDDGNVTADTE